MLFLLKHAETIPKAPYVLSVYVPKKHAKTDKQNRNDIKGPLDSLSYMFWVQPNCLDLVSLKWEERRKTLNKLTQEIHNCPQERLHA